jgi:hypothetical protein
MSCDLYHRNGQRGSSVESAATFMNLNLRKRDFVIVHITVLTMGTVTFASALTALFGRRLTAIPKPRSASASKFANCRDRGQSQSGSTLADPIKQETSLAAAIVTLLYCFEKPSLTLDRQSPRSFCFF